MTWFPWSRSFPLGIGRYGSAETTVDSRDNTSRCHVTVYQHMAAHDMIMFWCFDFASLRRRSEDRTAIGASRAAESSHRLILMLLHVPLGGLALSVPNLSAPNYAQFSSVLFLTSATTHLHRGANQENLNIIDASAPFKAILCLYNIAFCRDTGSTTCITSRRSRCVSIPNQNMSLLHLPSFLPRHGDARTSSTPSLCFLSAFAGRCASTIIPGSKPTCSLVWEHRPAAVLFREM
ncbi:hypothetical protein BDV93DRAFT_325512 [Ceratobasidium sp. AG-I]|nr:hypothetical protein BDV93DRAFT_325512 [Ceratobasidium sp. AG-I]